jgi:ubiquinone biosynthesis protein
MLKRNRVYRFLLTGFIIAMAVRRYLWIRFRAKLPFWKPTERTWERAHARTGRSIFWAAAHLGGAFVKLGQVIGARADFFPAALVDPLKKLHDRVPARPYGKLRKHVERQLGRPTAEIFADISEEPIAAASLAQVHRARLINGDDVVLKIQYPEARRLFPVDFASLKRAVRVVRWLNKKVDLRVAADELAEFILLELDFEREARSTERVREAMKGDDQVRIPATYPEYSTGKLLVLEYIEGVPISDVEAVREAGHDLRAVAERVANIYCTMIFDRGFFHGDPHPGNLLVLDDGTIGLLDFGLAKELPDGFGHSIARMIVKGMAGDMAGAMEAGRDAGFVFGDGDPEQLRGLLEMLLGNYGGPDRLLNIVERTNIESIPGHFTLIVRVMVLLNGLSHLLVPEQRVIAGALMRALAPHVAANAA